MSRSNLTADGRQGAKGPESRLALVASRRPDILSDMDDFARQLAASGLGSELVAWQVLGDYCGRALDIAISELGMSLRRNGETDGPWPMAN